MSREIESGIFDAIIGYFRKFSPPWVNHVISVNPIPEADVYHYHRPHLESSLLPNSVCTVHHDLNDPDVWHSLTRFLPRYREASAVVCLNSVQKTILIDEGISASRLFVAPHGYNDQLLTLKKRSVSPKDYVTLGVVSRRYGRRVKGEAYLLELAKRLDPQFFRFLLVGQDRTIDAVTLRGLGFQATAFDRLPYTVFQGLYEEMDALLMCSSHEGGPANIPEALGTGTPVFSSPVGMSKDMIIDGKNGIFLSMEPNRDADRITSLCKSSPEMFSAICRKAMESAHATVTWRQSIEMNLNVYSGLIGADITVRPISSDIGDETLSHELEELAA